MTSSIDPISIICAAFNIMGVRTSIVATVYYGTSCATVPALPVGTIIYTEFVFSNHSSMEISGFRKYKYNQYMQCCLWSYAAKADEAKIISNAPFVFTNSFWNFISAATFFLRRRNNESINGDWPSTTLYISVGSFVSLGCLLERWTLPITTPATSHTISPKRGSVTCLRRSRRMGSKRTSSRPDNALRRPSRCINSCIRENVVVGGTCCIIDEFRPNC